MSPFVQIRLCVPAWLEARLVEVPQAGDWSLSLAAETVLNRHAARGGPVVPMEQADGGRPLSLHVPRECAERLRQRDADAPLGDLALGALVAFAGPECLCA